MWLAIRYRRNQALVLLALSALITASAVLTPLYDRAMQQALTRLAVDSATASETAIQVRAVARSEYPQDSAPPAPTRDQLAALLPEEARPWFQPRVDSGSALVTRADQTVDSPTGALEWRERACDNVEWLAGGCPTAPGDIAVSAADRRTYRLEVGSRVDVVEQPGTPPERELRPVALRVTGVYRQVPGPFWTDRLLTGLSGFREVNPPYRPMHDTWLTAAGTFTGPDAPPWLDPAATVTYALDRSAVGVDELVRTGAVVAGMTERSRLQVDDLGEPIGDTDVTATIESGLPAIAATVDRGRDQARVTVPLLMTQLGLLALFVLGLTLGAAVEQRRPEVAVARLRGAGRAGARRLVLAELLPVVLAGVPLGTAIALGAATLARHLVLEGAAPFELGRGFWLAIAGALLLLTVLTWLVAGSGTRDGIPALLRSVPVRVRGWRLGAADAMVVAGCGVAVLAFVTGDLHGPLALAAPALLALVAGLLLAHLIVPAATGLAHRMTARGAYAAALALLAVARRPATRRVVTVVTVAAALLVFSAYAVSVGSRNRQLAAQRDNGAAMVADLTGTDVARVRAALAPVADGAGGRATPVVRVGEERSLRTTLAVDPADFGRVALLPDSDPAAVPWSRLRVPTGRRLVLTGRAVSLRLTPDDLDISREVPVKLRLQLLDVTGAQQNVDLGEVPTTGPRTLAGAVRCTAGCTVVGVAFPGYAGTIRGRLTIDEVRVTGGRTDLPGTVADWRPVGSESRYAEAKAAAPGRLTLEVDSEGTDSTVLASRYLPDALPALLAGPDAAPGSGTVVADGLNGVRRPLVGIAELPRIPAVRAGAAVVDLDLLQHWGSRTGRTARIQVWFDSEDPAALERVRGALRTAGIEISGVRRVSEVRAAYDRSVPAWSLELGVLAAVVAVALAGLVLVLLAAATGRRRSRDLACLGMSGVPRRGLARVATGEQLPVVVLAVLAGAGCGLVGAAFALPTVPLFAETPPDGTLDLSAPWGSVLAALAAALAALAIVAWLCGRAVAARARLARVRESV